MAQKWKANWVTITPRNRPCSTFIHKSAFTICADSYHPMRHQTPWNNDWPYTTSCGGKRRFHFRPPTEAAVISDICQQKPRLACHAFIDLPQSPAEFCLRRQFVKVFTASIAPPTLRYSNPSNLSRRVLWSIGSKMQHSYVDPFICWSSPQWCGCLSHKICGKPSKWSETPSKSPRLHSDSLRSMNNEWSPRSHLRHHSATTASWQKVVVVPIHVTKIVHLSTFWCTTILNHKYITLDHITEHSTRISGSEKK